MCGIAGYSVQSGSSLDRTLAAQALLAAIAERGADAVGYAYRAPRRHLRDRREAADARVAAPRADRRAGRGDPASRPRARLHEGSPVDQRQQPPGAARPGGRDPQRDHHERRRAPRPPLLRAGRAEDDGRLRGDLRARGALPERRACARAPPRRAGDGWLDEREPGVVFLARGSGRPLWLGEGRGGVFFASTQLALEVVERYCRLEAAQARGRRPARGSRSPAARSSAESASGPTSSTSSPIRCPPCGRPASATSA